MFGWFFNSSPTRFSLSAAELNVEADSGTDCHLHAVIFDLDFLALSARHVNHNLKQVVQDELEALIVGYNSEIVFRTVY